MLSFGKMGEKFLVGIGFILVIALTVGTGAMHNLSWDKLKETHWKVVTGMNGKELQREAANLDKAQPADEVNVPDEEETSTAMGPATEAEETIEVVLYYADPNGENLVAETREIPKAEGIARATVKALLQGPTAGEVLQNTIPAGTQLNDINIEDGICTVDFSSELRNNHWGGSTGELLTVYSIVDVLTQFPTVEKVQFLIDGKTVNTLVGHMDLSQPLERNDDIIK